MDQTAKRLEADDSSFGPSEVDLGHPTKLPTSSRVKQPWLLGKWTDGLMAGGASIVLFGASWLFVAPSSSIVQVSWIAFYLAIVVNNPHFMASYLFLYQDRRAEIFKTPRYFWAAVVVPLLLFGYFGWAVFQRSNQLLGFGVNAMYFLVGWHYVKQIYGTLVVSSARQKYYFSTTESWILKGTLIPVWFLSYFNGNLGVREVLHYGVGYKTFAISPWLEQANRIFLAVGLIAVAYVLFSKWVKEGRWPSTTGLISLAAIFIWYLPEVYHPHFWYLIPFFHSLQYLLFVFTLKKNQFWAEASATAEAQPIRVNGSKDEVVRSQFGLKLLTYGVLIISLGALSFKYVPEFLDRSIAYDQTLFGKELFAFLFITFINIHHYFIDNVIWRRDNPAVRSYL